MPQHRVDMMDRAQLEAGAYWDLDDYLQQLSNWDLDILQLSPGETYSHYQLLSCDSFELLSFGHRQRSRHIAAAVKPGYSFFIPDIDSAPVSLLAREHREPIVVCVPAGQTIEVMSQAGYLGYTLNIDEDVLRSHLEARGVSLDAMPKVTTSYNCSEQQARRLSAHLRQLSAAFAPYSGWTQGEDTTHKAPEVIDRTALESMLAKAEQRVFSELMPLLVDMLCKGPESDPSHTQYQRQQLVDRALLLIHQNLDDPISSRDLAEQIGTSTRNLQYMFKQYVGLSPKAYTQAVRLNEVRRDLRRNQPRKGIISELANRRGFWHMGQFSKDFKSFFAQTPGQLLRYQGLASPRDSLFEHTSLEKAL